jgi:hypothetical protein
MRIGPTSWRTVCSSRRWPGSPTARSGGCASSGGGLRGQRNGDLAPDLWNSLKTSRRADHTGEPGPIAVQIAGTEPGMMADAARYNVTVVRRSSTSIWAARPRRCATNGPVPR